MLFRENKSKATSELAAAAIAKGVVSLVIMPQPQMLTWSKILINQLEKLEASLSTIF